MNEHIKSLGQTLIKLEAACKANLPCQPTPAPSTPLEAHQLAVQAKQHFNQLVKELNQRFPLSGQTARDQDDRVSLLAEVADAPLMVLHQLGLWSVTQEADAHWLTSVVGQRKQVEADQLIFPLSLDRLEMHEFVCARLDRLDRLAEQGPGYNRDSVKQRVIQHWERIMIAFPDIPAREQAVQALRCFLAGVEGQLRRTQQITVDGITLFAQPAPSTLH